VSEVPDPEDKSQRNESGSFNGMRRLIRPRLLRGERRHDPNYGKDPLSHAMQEPHTTSERTHAEAFYFQKQIQQQTEMTVVLEDGEEIRGLLEWYDRCVVKLRAGRRRVLIYKTGIKYLYKSSDAQPASTIMK
jgi:sRNA-binding regulator protein Hfq